MADRTLTGVKILSAKRLNNSRYGNPRFRVRIDAEPYEADTQSDAACSYEVENFTHSRHRDSTFTLTLTRADRIATITLEK